MKYQLKNMTRRPVSILCNSGKSYHLPPKHCLEISETEIDNNAFVNKLKDRKVIDISSAVTEEEKRQKPKQAPKNPKRAPADNSEQPK